VVLGRRLREWSRGVRWSGHGRRRRRRRRRRLVLLRCCFGHGDTWCEE